MKKTIAILLAVLMLASVIPITAGATNEVVVATGEWSSSANSWVLYEDGTLELDSTYTWEQSMGDYSSTYSPWFEYREQIENVVINCEMSKIGAYAFYNCYNLKSITFVNSSSFSVGDYAFYGCSSLTGVYVFSYFSTGGSIGEYAFAYCSSLKEVAISTGVSIGAGAFKRCSALEKIYICGPAISEYTFSVSSDSFYGVNADVLYPYNSDIYDSFKQNYGGSLTWQSSFTGFCGQNVMWEYDSENKVLTVSGNGAIAPRTGGLMMPWGKFCSDITKIIVEDGINYIPSYVFEYCENVETLILPESVKYFCTNALNDCKKLNNIILPDSIEEFGYAQFNRCSALTDLYYMGTAEEWDQIINSENVKKSSGSTLNIHFLVDCSTAPTCMNEGTETYYQFDKTDVYSDLYNTNKEVISSPVVLPKTDHSFTDYVSNGDGTCNSYGTKTAFCDYGCGNSDTITDTVRHSYSDGICTECGGIEDGYIAIYSKEDLNNVRNDLNSKYILMNDIVFTDADFEEGGVLYGETWGDYGTGWLPIGLEFTNNISATYFPFKGVFNGNGYSIVNLKMNRESTAVVSLDDSITTIDSSLGVYPYDSFGLFAYNEGTVKNLTLVADFKIFIDNEIVVGGICGTNQGLVSDCRTEGTIYIENKTEHSDCYFGGIAGRLREGTITRCANDIDFCGTNEASHPYMNCGGIVGGLSGSANVISYCYNTGDIAILTPAVSFFGGIVARTFNTEISILNCYNAGNIGYEDFKGLASGICAEFYKEMDSTAIRNCYNVGNIIAETKTTGILYCIDNVEYDDACYYLNVSADYGCCNWDDDNYQIDKNSLFSSQMKTEEAFDGFDFEDVWIVDAKADYPYPQLRNNLQSETELVRHIYSEQTAKEATCTENGIVRYTCDDCGFTLDVDTKATGHNYEKSGETAPTCTERGYTTYTCSNCSSSYDSLYVAATGHNYKAVESSPTCTEQGFTTYTCDCGDTYVGDFVDSNGHSYDAVVTIPATHLTEGLITYTCECGDTYTEKIAKTTEHNHNAVVTAPTCTEQGFTTYTCECGDTYTADFVEAVGHNYKKDVTAPTCEDKGFTTYTCDCGDTYVGDFVDASGHDYEAVVTTPATHLTEGLITYTCECGDTYTEKIAKTTEHNHNAVVTAATCTEQGFTTYTCECGDIYVGDYVDAKGHEYASSVSTPATHLTEGLIQYTCECGDSYSEVIPTLPEHTYTSEVIEEPDCKNNGTRRYYCECGHSYTESIYKLEHIDDDDNSRCDRCNVAVCSHMCHKTGFMGFIWKIVLFFSKLFGINPVCECGKAHY